MDQGRAADLARMQREIDNISLPMWKRQRAFRIKQSILLQLKDKKLTRLRERLIKAAQAGDEYEQWKIENLIKAHLHEEQLEVKYYA